MNKFGLFSERKFRSGNVIEKLRSTMRKVRLLERADPGPVDPDSMEGNISKNRVVSFDADGNPLYNIEPTTGDLLTPADVQWINWWLPITLADDSVNYIQCQAIGEIGGEKCLVVGGDFQRIGGVSSPYIALYRFSTRQWEALGATPLNGIVYALAFDGSGNLYAGGSFTNAGGDANADYIAKWNGSAWSALGATPLNGPIASLTISGSNVYAGGVFTNAGGDANADCIAMWNGSAWSALGSGLNNNVTALVFDASGNLYAGGSFTNAGGDANADYIAKWNGSAWSALGSTPLSSVVSALAIDGSGNLYAGGSFTNAGGDANADYIAKWNGSVWSALGTEPLNNKVIAIDIDADGNVYAGGPFTDIYGKGRDSISYYDGLSWHPLTNAGGISGLAGNVYSIVIDDDTNSIFAGGDFDTAGTIKCASLACFVRPLADAIDIIAGLFEQYQARGNVKYILTSLLGAANGAASLDASLRVVEAIKRIYAGTGSLTATEGYAQWQSTTKRLLLYDAQRERALSSVGWAPSALPMIYDPSAALTTAYTLAANGGTIVIPIMVTGHMLLQGVTIRNTDTGTARSWRWHLYEQYSNNGDSAENTLTRIESGNGNDSFTPGGAASNRTLNGTGAPTYLAPGVYWLAIQNVHATSTFGLASTAVGSSAFAPNSAQSKTLTVPLGSTLDLVAATWTKLVDIYAVRLNGRVFGQTTAF